MSKEKRFTKMIYHKGLKIIYNELLKKESKVMKRG
jgi:hypothetical protein